MPKRSPRYFVIFLLLSITVFTLSKLNLLEFPQSYISKASIAISSPIFLAGDFLTQIFQSDTEKKLREENLNLLKKLVDEQKLIEENKALHDQFLVVNPRSLDLLPADVLSAPRFIPGLFLPEFLVIDKGENDKVKTGDGVILKDNLLGKVTKTTSLLSEVTLISNTQSKFAAKTQSGVLGIVKGEGNGDLLFDNVLLSDHLEKGEKILTAGDMRLDSAGFPPDIIVGEIVSVEKNPTDLFQRAKLRTLTDFPKISRVFVIKGLR